MNETTPHDFAPPAMTAPALAACLNSANPPLVLDVRKAPAFDAAPDMIVGALRIAPDRLVAAMATLPLDRDVVVYCVHGHQVSQGAARALIEAGYDAQYLEGGIEHWREAGLPLMSRSQG